MDYVATLIVIVSMGLLPFADVIGYAVGNPFAFLFKVAVAVAVIYLLRKALIYILTYDIE